MSSRVYVDGRTVQLMNCDAIIRQALQDLGASRAAASCGRAEVHTSNLDVADAVKAFEAARYQDRMDERPTNALEARLSAARPDYDAQVLGDWRPAVDQPSIHVDDGQAEGHDHMRLVEDLECAALDGARLMVFAVEDDLGNTSYQVGLETSLFDEQGNWKDEKLKSRYESFLTKVKTAQAEADKPLDPADGAARALKAAGLMERRRQSLGNGRSAAIFTNSGNAEAKPEGAKKKRSFSVGG
jgi:hypothetical protein